MLVTFVADPYVIGTPVSASGAFDSSKSIKESQAYDFAN